MTSPFEDVPLNTKQVYVAGTAPSGCIVYLPVDTYNNFELQIAKDALDVWLNKTRE